MSNNLINEIENNIDNLLISNNFNINNIYDHIKEIAIIKTVDYYFEKSSFDELINNVLVLEYFELPFTNIAGYSYKHIGDTPIIGKLVSGDLKLFDSEMAKVSHGIPATNDIVIARLLDNYNQKVITFKQLTSILETNRQDFIQRGITDQKLHTIFKSTTINNRDELLSYFAAYSLSPPSISNSVQTQSVTDTSSIEILANGELQAYINKLQDPKISPNEIYKLLSLNDIRVSDIPMNARLNIINNKSFFELFRVNPTTSYNQTKSFFADIVGLSDDIKVSSKYSEILNNADLSKVDKHTLIHIFSKYKDYGIGINENTINNIKNILRNDVLAVTNNSSSSTTVTLLSDTQYKELIDIGKKQFGINDTSNWITASKWILLLSIIVLVFNKSSNAYNFIYYKWYIDKLIKIFKYNDFFTNKVTAKLLKYDDDFKKCSDYGSFSTPFKMTFNEKENFKIQICFFKYVGATYLFLCKNYKEYLRYKGVKLPDKINEPMDLFGIRDERIGIDIKNSLYNMNKIVDKFFDLGYKNRLNMLFKLTISDNFDISRFEFDDFK